MQERLARRPNGVRESHPQVLPPLIRPRQGAVDPRRRAGLLLGCPSKEGATSGWGERRFGQRALVLAERVEGAQRGRDRGSVGQPTKGVRPVPRRLVALIKRRLGVLGAQPPKHWVVPQAEPRLVPAEDLGVRGIEAAEVKEAQRATVDPVTIFSKCQRTTMRIPIRNVVLRLAHDGAVRHETGDEVEPPLVDEIPVHGVNAAVPNQAVTPPGDERPGFVTGRDRNVPQVVDAGDHYVDLARSLCVIGDRHRVVRGKRHAVLPGGLVEPIQRREHLDVWIEVGDDICAGIQLLTKQPGLDRGRELQHVVARRHARERLTVDVGR